MVLVLVAPACGGSSDSAEVEALREEVASLKTTTVAPTTTLAPTTTVAPTTTATPTTTVAPTTTATPTTTTAGPLSWPSDVGSSRFGVLGQEFEVPGGWIRPHPGEFLWSEIQPTPDRWDWGRIDWHVNTWQDRRLAILGTLWPFAQWDQENCHANDPEVQPVLRRLPTKLFAPCDETKFVSWLTAVVERYDGDGVEDMPGLAYPIRHWEVANEPSMQGGHGYFFQGTSADYLSMLRLAFETITTADPEATVLTGGQAGMQPPFTDFWTPVLESATGLFHVGNIHSISSDHSFFSDDYRALLDETGHAGAEYWITEALVSTWPEPPSSMRPTGDELGQKTFTGFATAFADGASRIFNVGPHDPTGGPGPESDSAFLLLAETVGDFTSASWAGESLVRFDMPDGRTVYLAWGGAGLPDTVTGVVETVGYDGTAGSADATGFSASVPTLVTVE